MGNCFCPSAGLVCSLASKICLLVPSKPLLQMTERCSLRLGCNCPNYNMENPRVSHNLDVGWTCWTSASVLSYSSLTADGRQLVPASQQGQEHCFCQEDDHCLNSDFYCHGLLEYTFDPRKFSQTVFWASKHLIQVQKCFSIGKIRKLFELVKYWVTEVFFCFVLIFHMWNDN